MKKNPQTQGANFINFYRLSWSYLGLKSNLHPTHKSINYGYANFEIVYFVPLYISISSISRAFEPVPFSFNSGSVKKLNLKLINHDISNTWKSHTFPYGKIYWKNYLLKGYFIQSTAQLK